MRHPMLRDIPFETAVEYTVDFISRVGAPTLYNEKTAVVEIRDWRGQLPCDFVNMIQVRVAKPQTSRRWIDVPCLLPQPVYRAADDSFFMSDMKPNALVLGNFTYRTEGMVIFTSTKDIDVEIAYNAFAVDDEGYPLLAENSSFLEGLGRYIKFKWFEMKYDQGEISDKVMERAESQYYWAVSEAYAEFSRLDVDHAVTLFNSFTAMVPLKNDHARGYFGSGAQEIWKRH